jgi:hypothetical protein
MHVASNDFGDGDGSERWAQKFTKLFLFISAAGHGCRCGAVVSRSCIIAAGTLQHAAAWTRAECAGQQEAFYINEHEPVLVRLLQWRADKKDRWLRWCRTLELSHVRSKPTKLSAHKIKTTPTRSV